MTKTFVGAMAGLHANAPGQRAEGRSHRSPNSQSRPPITRVERLKDEVAYWALRIYMRFLKIIGDVSELTANYRRKEAR